VLLLTLDLIGTFAFALSGAFRAVKHELDWLGLVVLATATGVGGGIIRDVLLGATPPAALQQESYLALCFVGAAIAVMAKKYIAYHWDLVMLADALGLGVFAAIGAVKAEHLGAGPITIVLMAALTATGGGVIRDVLVMEIPAILKSDFYATAALLGGGVFLALGFLGVDLETRMAVTVLVTTLLRLLAMRHKVQLPKVQSSPVKCGDLEYI
jgi:uncharacterized membrane protein YeiH